MGESLFGALLKNYENFLCLKLVDGDVDVFIPKISIGKI